MSRIYWQYLSNIDIVDWNRLRISNHFRDFFEVCCTAAGIEYDSAKPALDYNRRISLVAGYMLNGGRLAIALVFIGSYLLRPLQDVIMKVWLRLTESDKPIFTFLFGGVGVIAEGTSRLIGGL
jgi:hypothetical protein